ncbi:MAG: 6-phosphogluconolactonase [Pseudomonadota bacterium]
MPVVEFIEFDTREELAQQLAEDVAMRLEPDLEEGTFGSLALSGGNTPKLFLQTLAARDDFQSDMTYVALVDERHVPPDHERSNERMIRENAKLQDHPASEFLSLWHDGKGAAEMAATAQAKLRGDEELPFDVLILGMGGDGHTASFFPDSPDLASVTDPNAEALFAAVETPSAPDTRLTMTLPVIATASYLVLHIEGAEKRETFETAMADGDANELPIRHVIRDPRARIHVYWAP